MIILDTNVVSALMRASADDDLVAEWLDAQPVQSIWATTITVFEVQLGIELLPRSKRRNLLEQAFSRLIANELANRVLSFDAAAAVAAANLAANRQRAGRVVDIRDTQIAGIAIARRAAIATRNVKHFDDLPVSVVNPFVKN